MPKLRLAGGAVKLHYHDAGAGSTPVLFLHGFPFTSEMWLPQRDALAGSHRVIIPDLRGFGASETLEDGCSMARLADDAAELLDALGLRQAVIAGLSMGGYVAFEFFNRHRDRVLSLALCDTRPEPDSDEARSNRAAMAQRARSEGSGAVADELLPKLLSNWSRAQKHDLERFLRDMMESVKPETIEAALVGMANRTDSRPLLPRIDVPVLVVVGSEDPITPPDDVRAWAAQIPNARVEVVEGAAHVPNLEQPGPFNTVLADFLAGLSDATPGAD
jgi:pimeloyl-ACP methyl ester carboxylesterase